MRSLFFNIGFWAVSTVYVLLAAVLALSPGYKGVRWAVRRYSRRMVQLMKLCESKSFCSFDKDDGCVWYVHAHFNHRRSDKNIDLS